MLSLSNAFSKEDMEDFKEKILNYLNFKDQDIEFFLNQKLTVYQPL